MAGNEVLNDAVAAAGIRDALASVAVRKANDALAAKQREIDARDGEIAVLKALSGGGGAAVVDLSDARQGARDAKAAYDQRLANAWKGAGHVRAG